MEVGINEWYTQKQVAERLGVSPKFIAFTLNQLFSYIKEGIIKIVEGIFIVRSAYRKTNLELPIKMLDDVKQLAGKRILL